MRLTEEQAAALTAREGYGITEHVRTRPHTGAIASSRIAAPPFPWVLVLTYPPSVNGLFANVPGRGRVKTERYRTWLSQAGGVMRDRRWQGDLPPDPCTAALCVSIDFYPPDQRKRDIDNGVKALFDLLVAQRVIGDDSQIRALHLHMHEPEPETARAVVTLNYWSTP